MRKTLVWLGVVALLVVAGAGAQAAPPAQMNIIGMAHPIDISVNGQTQHFDAPALVVNGRTLVPLRGVLESLGHTVSWQGHNGMVRAHNSQEIRLRIGSRDALVGGRLVRLATPPRLLGHRVYVPVQFVREHLGASVAWIPAARRVDIASASAPAVAGFREPVTPSPTPLEQGQLPPPLVCPPSQQAQVTPHVVPQYSAVQPMDQSPATVVQVGLDEYKITLSTDTVPAGPVTFQIVNNGKHKHGLDIENTDLKSGVLEPGQSATLTADLQPNTYTLYCPVDAHRQLGMKTRLMVQ